MAQQSVEFPFPTMPPDRCFMLVLTSMVDGLCAVGPGGVVLCCNAGLSRITGYEHEALLGQPVSLLDGPSLLVGHRFSEIITMVLREHEEVRSREITLRAKDGSEVPVLVNAGVIWDPGGEALGAIVNITDTTELVRAKAAIRQLSGQLKERYGLHRLIGKSSRMQEIYEFIECTCRNRASVLIQGESGTGKELVAAAIHFLSPRSSGPFMKVNCSALAESLLESELFGHVKGAFTGAISDQVGRFEAADGGTIFLDEVGDLTPTIQTKLLRVTEDREFERVGESRTRKADVRIISATNKDLWTLVKQGKFREDLYYRLKVIALTVPPLRERKEDILLLVAHFIEHFSRDAVKPITGCSRAATSRLLAYDWPGNVRELEHAIEHAIVLARGEEITLMDLPEDIRRSRPQGGGPARQALVGLFPDEERRLIAAVLKEAGGNRSHAAKALGIGRTTLWKKLKSFGIQG
jgi:PAS domain S-box-containing protein